MGAYGRRPDELKASLGVVYTMGLEVVPRSCKICDLIGCWTRHGITSVYTKEKNVKSDHEVQGPQKTYFKVYIIYWHGPTSFAMGRSKRGALLK
jgi:hypothetical protein